MNNFLLYLMYKVTVVGQPSRYFFRFNNANRYLNCVTGRERTVTMLGLHMLYGWQGFYYFIYHPEVSQNENVK